MSIDFKNKQGFLVLGLLMLLLFAFIRFDGQIPQYLFFLRVPLIAGLLLFALPAICIYLLPTILGNLFVLSNALRMALVIPGAIAVGLGIALIGAVIGANADERFGVLACPWLEGLTSEQSLTPYILGILLSFPTILTVYWSSGPASREMPEKSRWNGTLLGALLSVFFLVAVYWVRKNIPSTGFANGLMQLSSLLPEPAQAGFVINTGKGSTLANGHLMMGS